MPLLYDIGIGLYHTGIKLSAPFNPKAKKWTEGRKDLFEELKNRLNDVNAPIWIHCSSYGEYEQGRPIIDALREQYQNKKIVLTFYSPSGYEQVKTKEVDLLVFYLPPDGSDNARQFLQLVDPCMAVFVKYEFWYHYLYALKETKVPTFLISGIFRKEQPFFKWFGGTHRKMLATFEMLFVQDERSKQLLNGIDVLKVKVTGDTRFDRVLEIAKTNDPSAILKEFTNGADNVLVAGSTWPKDEDLLSSFFSEHAGQMKLIIAPHEIHKSHIDEIQGKFKKVVLWSNIEGQDLNKAEVLIIDTIGMLSRIYRSGTIAYIGGGFNDGIHNILEAAVYGLPILFGPNYKKFKEAVDLINKGGASCITDQRSLNEKLDELNSENRIRKAMGDLAGSYVQQNSGATAAFMNYIENRIT